jgi:hypothetical protein
MLDVNIYNIYYKNVEKAISAIDDSIKKLNERLKS